MPSTSLSSRFALLRPDFARGTRAALATVVPLYFSLTRHTHTIAWIALAGWLGSLADPGGTRGRRARVLFGFLAFGTALVVVGEGAAPSLVLSAVVLSAAAFSASLLRAVDADAGSLGTTLLVATAIATANPRGAPVHDGGAFALGALWAIALSSVVWPIWTHLPVRRAIASVFGALSAYASDLEAAATGNVPHADPAWTEIARTHHRAIRSAIEEARRVALSMRMRREGESRLGSNLRALFGVGEASFFWLVAFADEIESSSDPRRRARAAACLGSLAALYSESDRRLHARNSGSRPIEAVPEASPSGASPLEIELLESARAARAVARAPATAVAGQVPLEALHGARHSILPADTNAPRALRDAFSLESPFFRHGIRVACTVVVAFLLGRKLSPAHVAWVTVTAIAVLQPYPGATAKRASERVIGTVLGCFVTVILMALVHEPWQVALVMFPLSVAAVITRPRSYRWFTFFLTPVFVLDQRRAFREPARFSRCSFCFPEGEGRLSPFRAGASPRSAV